MVFLLININRNKKTNIDLDLEVAIENIIDYHLGVLEN